MERIRVAIAMKLPAVLILEPVPCAVWQTEMHSYVRSFNSLMKKKRASGSSSMRSSQEKWPSSMNWFVIDFSQEISLTPLRRINVRLKRRRNEMK